MLTLCAVQHSELSKQNVIKPWRMPLLLYATGLPPLPTYQPSTAVRMRAETAHTNRWHASVRGRMRACVGSGTIVSHGLNEAVLDIVAHITLLRMKSTYVLAYGQHLTASGGSRLGCSLELCVCDGGDISCRQFDNVIVDGIEHAICWCVLLSSQQAVTHTHIPNMRSKICCVGNHMLSFISHVNLLLLDSLFASFFCIALVYSINNVIRILLEGARYDGCAFLG